MRSLLSKNQIKFVRSLKQKKYRYHNKKYIVEGPRMISDLIEERPHLIQYIISAKDSKTISIPAEIPSYELDQNVFKDLSEMVASQGVMAVCHIPDIFFEKSSSSEGFVLLLDGVQDPGNLGTILRAAEYLGIDELWIGPGTTDPFSPKSVQAAMGSQAFMKIHQMGHDEILQSSLPLIVADMDGQNVFRFQWPQNGILVMGNEGKGPSSFIRENAAHLITIPALPGRMTESLNVGMACTSLLTLRMSQLSRG